MSDEEINKTIAEFMEYSDKTLKHIESGEYHLVDWHDPFTESLDALVPVVEKLGKPISLNYETSQCEWFVSDLRIGYLSNKKSPAKALALACYKVIKERG